jgi:hypothetical protein
MTKRSVLDVYIDRKRQVISPELYDVLIADDTYRILRRFENDNLSVTLHWDGKIRSGVGLDPDQWKPFYLDAINILRTDVLGNAVQVTRLRDDDLSDKYCTEQEAIDGYEHVLVTNGGCEWMPGHDEAGNRIQRLYEKGNIFAAGKDRPQVTSQTANAEDFNSW